MRSTRPITEPDGDSLAWAFPRLQDLVAELGCSLVIEPHPDGRGGSYHPDLKRISLNQASSTNPQIKTLVHELAHALLRHPHDDDEDELTYSQEELVVESVALTVVGGLGYDTSDYPIPYSSRFPPTGDGCTRRCGSSESSSLWQSGG